MKQPFRYFQNNSGGYALVLVLFFTLMCAVLVVILMERSLSSLKSASTYQQVAQLRSLSDMAVNVVQAQIRDATTTNQMPTTALNSRDTWASQPGAIRVYSPSGSLRNIYKLYSSGSMQTTDVALAGDVPTDWFSRQSEYTDLNDPVNDGSQLLYPIINPTAAALNPTAPGIASGFGITNAPVKTGSNPNPAPMPVKWIYALEDGTLCQLGDPRINKTTNPIIGRIAFWTDDETSKVNLNTASPTSSSSYWDMPRTSTSADNKLAWNQPAQNEYQRYPGHPATVSLIPVLGTLGGTSLANYYDVTPKYRWGGSEDGTKDIKPTTGRTSLLTNKSDRNYATVDEVLFGSTPTALRTDLTPQQVDSLRFFLTTSSRAPELNLFGQPRVSIWPISAVNDALYRTPYDNLIAFCSTIGGKAYHFVRNDPLSATADYTSFTRNQELYGYLQKLTAVQVPGFGGSTFLAKYSADRDQILTEIFDYIRCTNLNETYQGRAAGFKSYTPDLRGGAGDIGSDLTMAGAGFVVPITIGNTHGGGRFPTIQGAGLWFVQHLQDPTQPESASNKRMLQATLTLKTTTPMCGFMPWQAAKVVFSVTNSTVKFTVSSGSSTATFPGGTTRQIDYSPLVAQGQSPGGYEGAAWTIGVTPQPWYGINPLPPYYSQDIPIENSSTFSVVGGTVDVGIRVGGTVVQSYRFTFPSVANIPLPTINPSGDTYGGNPMPWWALRGVFQGPLDTDVLRSVELSHGDARLALMADTSPTAPFADYLPHKDYTDTSKAFAHSMRGAVSLPYLWHGGTVGTYVQGLNYASPASPWDTATKHLTITHGPDIPSTITDLRAKGWSGDFDNGAGNFPDGPFLNMPDEGTTAYQGTELPYLRSLWTIADGLFSPLRQVPSAAMFGSLPTGVKAAIPWRTLLFCPNPPDPAHIGFSSPADHLLLDLFRMPVVEPYAISGPLSTDGKINMNYAIAPFSYIRRASSWYALLETLNLFAIPDSESAKYKGGNSTAIMRNRVDVSKTLDQFETRFASNDIFRSATEICSLFLVPSGQTLSSVSNLSSGYWSTHRLTGDNSREKPYAELYPKLTTQSNTYTVHMRVQVINRLDKPAAGQPDFVPVAEFRGSRLIERYLSRKDPRFSSVNPDTDNLNDLYQFRVLGVRQFNP